MFHIKMKTHNKATAYILVNVSLGHLGLLRGISVVSKLLRPTPGSRSCPSSRDRPALSTGKHPGAVWS